MDAESHNDYIVISYLISNLKLNHQQLEEILNGAFVVVIDDGKLFEGMQQLGALNPPCYHRKSSHPSLRLDNSHGLVMGGSAQGTAQLAVDGELNRTLIMGKMRCGKNCKEIIKDGDPYKYMRHMTQSIETYNPPTSLPINTWFQFESTRWQSPNQSWMDTWGHILTYFQYKMYKQNYGPNGESKFTGRPARWNPLIVKLKKKSLLHAK